MPDRTVLVALGPIPERLLGDVAMELQRLFGRPVGIGPRQQRPRYAFNEDRGQCHATAILRRLGPMRGAPDGAPVVGLTDVDLFVPDAAFVFGQADRDGRTALVSIARLAQGSHVEPADPARLRHRAQVETVQEFGHLLGLSHCGDSRCAMFLSHKASDTDRKGPGLCATCSSRNRRASSSSSRGNSSVIARLMVLYAGEHVVDEDDGVDDEAQADVLPLALS